MKTFSLPFLAKEEGGGRPWMGLWLKVGESRWRLQRGQKEALGRMRS